ncbi:MAG: aldo/keto reductase [Candidatus Aminicenantaceae bacterium]
MEYRNLGRTGVKVSCLCFGTDNFADPTPEEECVHMLDRALDAGINLLDTGDVYAEGEGERIIGRALKANKRRHQVLLATKVDFGKSRPGQSLDKFVPSTGINEHGNSRLNIIRACEGSLRRFQTDYIDLYQIHRHWPTIAIDETLRALDDLVRQGKIRYVGCSTHPTWAVMEALMVSELKGYVRYASEQSPYNLLDRRIENELVPMCQRHGIGIIAWAPLAMGVLAGRYKDAKKYPDDSRAAYRGGFYAERVTKRGIAVANEFAIIAENIGISPAQLAILWCKDQPGVTAPLIGPRTMEHLEDFLPVLDMELDDETREACDLLVPPGSAVANFFNTSGWMKMKIL